MSKPRPAIILVPVLLIVLGLVSYVVESQRAKQRSTLTGFFESQPSEVASRIQGRVASIHVKEGDVVKAGTVLIDLETASLTLDTAAKLAQAEQARQQLKEVVDGPRPEDIRKQEGAVSEAEANLAKLRNGPLPEEIAEAKARLLHAQAQYQKLKDGPRPEEIAEARAAERNAFAKLQQMQRGLTPQERAEAKARLDSAVSTEELAKRDAERYAELYREDAVSKQQADQKQTDLMTAQAKRREMEEANRLAELGTPKEEMEQARQAHLQALAALNLVLAGSRSEDLRSAQDDVTEARKAYQLVVRGSRSEDIQAAKARLVSARSTLDELRAGNRKEEIRQSQAAAAAAARNAGSAKASLAENVVKAPIDGVVERIPVALGDLVNAGTMVVRLADPNDLWLRVYVPEANLHSVAAGEKTLLKIDGVSDTLDAMVESVSTEGEFTPANLQTPNDRGKQVFGVRIRLAHPDARVKSGMAATVKQIGAWTL